MNVTELYCPNEYCVVRNIEVVSKHPAGEPMPAQANCPFCGERARFNWTLDEIQFRQKQSTMRDITLSEEQLESSSRTVA